MKYEDLIKELCEVIKESEHNACKIYENLELIETSINSTSLGLHEKDKMINKISDSYGLLQRQDLHRQKIERVVNFVCEYNNIDKTQYNIADSAKHISGNETGEEMVSDEELEALIKQMQQ